MISKTHYTERSEEEEKRKDYFRTYMSKLHPTQEKLIKLTLEHPRARMLGSADSILMLTNMIKFAGAKKCLDIGVYTGYSSLSWALSIPPDGQVVACDITDEFVQIGKPVWQEAGVDKKIDLRIAPAAETLQALIDDGQSGTFDFAFIDADKTGYDTYYELSLKLLRKNGIIAIDNTWWGGRVLAGLKDDSTTAVRQLNDKVKSDDRVEAVLIDSGDGVFLCLKK